MNLKEKEREVEQLLGFVLLPVALFRANGQLQTKRAFVNKKNILLNVSEWTSAQTVDRYNSSQRCQWVGEVFSPRRGKKKNPKEQQVINEHEPPPPQKKKFVLFQADFVRRRGCQVPEVPGARPLDLRVQEPEEVPPQVSPGGDGWRPLTLIPPLSSLSGTLAPRG